MLTKICVWLQTGAVLIPFFQQFTGINTIMFYATQLFAVLGQSGNAALLSTAIVGAVNVGSTIIAIILVDRLVCTSTLGVAMSPTADLWHACSPAAPACMLHVHAPAVLRCADQLSTAQLLLALAQVMTTM